ncbi:uncharacterized protein N7459_003817 [Penicillium hispanicum]|uniref:uncharacterized protein n=1 Tax=Penicillium hispanicum TaxID=1080232 RepID=UPI002540B0C3|nr:uncharacterized protein N7459_003817 [Penicillium hispanicum]KAJ5584017.1 hypothetical protein N7459_003817 [Penicillium hispanicum]
MPATKVALAGATGNLGRVVLQALLDANIPVIVLSRMGGRSASLTPHPSLSIREVDFSSVDSLAPALEGAEVVISCLATSAIGSQNPLIDASIVAGVKRFIPAEFGMDSLNPLCAQLPVCEPKVATQRYLIEKSIEHPGFSYSGIANGLFLDWCIKEGIIINPADRTATLYNGGDVPFSVTKLADVAKAVLGVIHNTAKTANRLLFVHSAVTTQSKLIQYAKEMEDREWKTDTKDTEEVRRESFAELNKDEGRDIDAAMLGFCICASWSTSYGCDFSDRLDNDLLGVGLMSEDDLRALVQSYL